MKKYWKTICISILIVAIISSYYIQKTAMASKNDRSFKIETISGNKEEIENLILQTSYKSNDFYHMLYISKDGSTNPNNQSFFRDLIAPNGPRILQKYIDEHRKFMRGKELDPRKYFEDKTRLIYTTFLDDGRRGGWGDVQIDTLDKNTNESSSFKIHMPVQTSYDWINMKDVYVGDGKINILTTNYPINGGEELHIYTIDDNKKRLVKDSILAKFMMEERGSSSIRIFNENNMIQNENYYLYMVEKYSDRKEDSEAEVISSQIYLYNNANNEVEEWVIPEELKPYRKATLIHEETIFIPVYSVNGLKLHRYHIEKKQWEEPLIIPYSSITSENDASFLRITEGKFYLVYRVSDGQWLSIGDLKTGELIYEGKIISEDKKNQEADSSLTIEQLYTQH
ncbi:hypothetical protein JTI58_23485 [Lysinibacillus fusiformis]|uniref:hypothetical protein n=1 Tax=Lysinibacillus fusiformis TaxID=28031 RepID=UPI0019671BA7|nr:hypothetical protein [Lysinibacillus fusiformis]QSB09897.1 hypothetical protein JTI58_23485 [Lysinibacillus fusiformis]